MTTLQPRGPYSQEELRKLYPEGLELQHVQILLRHGERSPVSARFQNAGLKAFWPYCSVARQMLSSTMASDAQWTPCNMWETGRRRLETFGADDAPTVAVGPKGEVDSVCNLGELTDIGRRTTFDLGRRLRHLYVDQLNFMPSMIHDADMIYLRATPIPSSRIASADFLGMYPSDTRAGSFPPITILTRAPADETLFPNDGNCRRFAQLSRAFAQRTADRGCQSRAKEWRLTPHPRLSGIMDTINSTLAHGTETRLPKEFYDSKGRSIIERIGVEEWFSGYQESLEYRTLGIGALMGDLVSRMVGNVEINGSDGLKEIGGKDGSAGIGRGGEKAVRLGLSGCHDTTLAAVLASLGAFEGMPWPPYTSHIALELFKKLDPQQARISPALTAEVSSRITGDFTPAKGWFGSTFNGRIRGNKNAFEKNSNGIGRKRIGELTSAERSKLDGFFVRIRYNDEVMTIPGCKPVGKHLDGDQSFCTLEAFKTIVDKYTPSHWKQACLSNLEDPAFARMFFECSWNSS